jgi:hypothetical protein
MSTTRVVAAALGVVLGLALIPATIGSAHAAGASPGASHTVAKRAPSGPPLTSPSSEDGGEETAGVPSAEGDQLVENGLSSPLCEGSTSAGLSSAAQSNCETSGFVGAPAPTNNYDLDVNIDVGALGLGIGQVLSVIQDVFIAPVWEALVWVVHALVVMLQWCYTLELSGGSAMSRVAGSMREAQASFTQPWLVLVLAIASLLTLYNGLVRRRVAETLGEALLTVAMMAVGLWVIADPLGTVGVVGQWANQASLGTLGAVAGGRTTDGSRALGDSMRALFAGAIEAPWCYLEFGNVRWCSDPASLDPRLREAASRIALSEQAKLSCRPSATDRSCSSASETSALGLAHSDELVREADTNGALFLAFPANGPERNSVKDDGSLLHVLCQSHEDTKCEGSTAAQAEFRSGSGTLPRMIGVGLIAIGVLGTTMLFGLIAVHLLIAAVLSLFLLLLAPFAVLAPALGEGGRAVFTGWLTRLFGAVSSKLIFSFLLGALLTMQRLLASLEPLGWWTQWFLISAFWWVAFFKRHQAMAMLAGRGSGPAAQRHQSIARRVGNALETPRAMLSTARWAKRRILSPAPDSERLRKRARATRQTARKRADEQVTRTLERDHADASARVQASPRIQARLSSRRAQLERVRRARETALAGGDRRRAAKLAVRGQRIEAELAHEQESLNDARHTVARGQAARRTAGSTHTHEQHEERARLIDAQAALPASARRQLGSKRRDYRALAGLAGYGRAEYARLRPREQREARLRIDHELAQRSQLGGAVRDVANAHAPKLKRREQRGVDRELDRALERRMRASGSVQPAAASGQPAATSRQPAAASGPVHKSPQPYGATELRARRRGDASGTKPADSRLSSSIMEDAREVAARRKRQLGFERPTGRGPVS